MAGVKKRLVVIDGKSVFYRGYYAMPNLSAPDGTPTGGVYGFGIMALEIVKKMDPDYVCVAWDKAKTNIRRRRELYPEYKANRKPAPPDFYVQIPLLKEMLKAFSWPLYEIDDHEADDIMGTFAKQASDKDLETILITSDKDVLQLASDDVTVAILKKGLTIVENFDRKHLQEVMGMTTEEFIDYKSLRGDPSDNLPGVAGVGEKTATDLIRDYGSMDNVYAHLNDIKPAVRTKLEKDKEMAYLTKKLVTLDTDVPLKLDFEAAAIENLVPNEVKSVFEKFNFKTLLRQLPQSMSLSDEEQMAVQSDDELGVSMKTTVIRDKKSLNTLQFDIGKYLVVHGISKDAAGLELRSVIVSPTTKETILFDLNGKLTLMDIAAKVKPHLEARNVELIGHELKRFIKAFEQHGVAAGPVGHDTKVAAFLINSLEKTQSLGALATSEIGYVGPDLDSLPPEEVEAKAPRIAAALWLIYASQVNKLEKLPRVSNLAKGVEWPVINVLAKMENKGVLLDAKYLKKMSVELGGAISDVEQSIYGHVEKEFNIASPKQLSVVLFEDLKLPTAGIKKTKTSFSTAASELAKLNDEHPIISHISKYRELTKLKSTYVDALPKQVDENSRLHTTFSLTVASTGRLSSHDPNLQNIPVRGETGRKIRTAFVAGKGNAFVTADYSQFELRIAAVLAGDKGMIESFNQDADIHVQTAAHMYDIDESDVTKQQRYSAKAVNFGVMYGQGVHGLSEGTGMNFTEAKDFIDRYFELRSDLKRYLDDLREQAKTEGYVETLLGRRRPTPDVNSSNFVVREAAKRAAINMPIQGTAADIMKLAMINADKALDADSDILLQIHDSMIVECPEAKASKVADQVSTIMEEAYKLDVTLKVDTAIGNNWGEI